MEATEPNSLGGGKASRTPFFAAGATLAFGLACLLIGTAAEQTSIDSSKLPPSSRRLLEPAPRYEDFVGAEACASCHQREYTLWKDSTHGQAGGLPHEAKIIARFDGQPLQFKDATVIPTTNRQGRYVFEIREEGGNSMELPVDAVVGGGHMQGGGTQSFFIKLSDGTIRFLPFDFIRKENLWFVQLRNNLTWVPVTRDISLQKDLANWPPHRALGTSTEFSNCQNCHGSQITLRFDDRARRHETRFQSLKINCESCHGPGRRHIGIVSQPGFERQPDLGMAPLATLTKDQSLLVCFQCHANKDALREESHLPGAPLEDYFSLKLPALGIGPFLADGRVRSFDYQGNHLYSDCYLNGSMTCVDCHEPHGQGYRDVFSRKLTGRFDNGQCTGCHASKALTPEQHSHHKAGSPGSQCVSCHMPYLQHRGIGTNLVFARSDHTIPIPRPAFDHQLGIENACQKCHAEKDLTWQEAKVKEWYGVLKPHHPAIANLVTAREISDPGVAAELLLMPEARHPMAQAAGLGTWMERFLVPNARADSNVTFRLRQLARNDDLDLKSMALAALHIGYSRGTEIQSFLSDQLSRLGQNDAPVRSRWGLAADKLGGAFVSRGNLPAALVCFEKSNEIHADNVVTMSHLALAHWQSGDPTNSVAWLTKAILLKPTKAALHFQLAQTLAELQVFPAAIRALEEGLKYSPDDAAARQLLEQLRGR